MSHFMGSVQFLSKLEKKFPISVNFSRAHIGEKDTCERVVETVKRYNIDPALITIEITEEVILTDFDVVEALTSKLRSHGFKISIDDFGTGYTGFSLWLKIHFDELKLDRCFFDYCLREVKKRSQLIVKTLVKLAHQLDIKVVSDGVETAEQLEYLKSIDCSIVQGYVYSKPLEKSEFINTWAARY